MSEFRIRAHPRGYIVEIKKVKKSWFRTKEYWTHFISVSGISEMPWYYNDFDIAMECLLFKLKCDTIINSR